MGTTKVVKGTAKKIIGKKIKGMREIIPFDLDYDFSSKFSIATIFSGALVAISLVLILVKGLNYGVDFRGGAEIQVNFESAIDLDDFRGQLEESGYDGATVQQIGLEADHEFLVKVQAKEEALNEVTQNVTKMLEREYEEQHVVIEKTDIVGPKAGDQLKTSGFLALAYALLIILLYIALRFDVKYAPGAIMALSHDVIILLGVWCLLDKEFTLQTVAALLAIIGYSVNDTVVVYDRVREHEDLEDGTPLLQNIIRALNETLSRTVLTSCTTLFVTLSMLTFGGKSIEDFFFALTIGVGVGTYSSIFVAAPAILFFDKFKKS